MSELFCDKHNVKKECLGGASAHVSNWYCPECDKDTKSPHIEDESTCIYKPDYKKKCENCGQSPCVVAEYSDGSEDYEFEMCGPCTFGSAKCIDPEEW